LEISSLIKSPLLNIPTLVGHPLEYVRLKMLPPILFATPQNTTFLIKSHAAQVQHPIKSKPKRVEDPESANCRNPSNRSCFRDSGINAIERKNKGGMIISCRSSRGKGETLA
jgi:hypothetical protein